MTREVEYLKHARFEKFIGYLFENLGYKVVYTRNSFDSYDLEITSLTNAHEVYYCDVKYYSVLRFFSQNDIRAIDYLTNKLKKGQKGLFITTAIAKKEYRKIAIKENVFILDIQNLLFLTNKNEEIYQNFLEVLNFSVTNIEAEPPLIPLLVDDKSEKSSLEMWQEKFASVKPGKEWAAQYECLCTEAMKLMMADYLTIWQEQQVTNDDLYRIDLICKIKNAITDDFFSTVTSFFNTRYVVFEFKNYQDKITQKEIYTTEKYLYDKALRKVAIVVSRKGEDKNALLAIKGSIRELGKVIISLNDDDMLKMLEMYYMGNSSTDYLAMKLDKLLIELEK